MSEETKRCSRCKRDLPLTGFSRNRSRTDGFHPWCKDCWKRYYEENREKVAARVKRYYGENREKVAASHRRWYEENREKEVARKKRYYEENREKEAARVKRYYEENREKVTASQKRRYAENREKETARKRVYNRSLRGQWVALKNHARNKGWDCDISEATFTGLRSRPCFYCGANLPVVGYGLDRLDSSKGYVRENVVPCCWSCNNEKGSMPWKDYATIWDMRRSGVPIMESERSYHMLLGYWKLWEEEDASD